VRHRSCVAKHLARRRFSEERVLININIIRLLNIAFFFLLKKQTKIIKPVSLTLTRGSKKQLPHGTEYV